MALTKAQQELLDTLKAIGWTDMGDQPDGSVKLVIYHQDETSRTGYLRPDGTFDIERGSEDVLKDWGGAL